MVAIWAIIVGLIAGLLSGGRARGLAEIQLRHEWVLLAAFVVQGVARGRLIGTSASPLAMSLWIAVSILLIVLLALNSTRRGTIVAASGVLLNVNVVLLNHGMPIGVTASPAALAGIAASGGFYHMAGLATLAAWAGDVLALRTMGHIYYLSAGDILLGVGVAVLIADAMIAMPPLRAGNGPEAG